MEWLGMLGWQWLDERGDWGLIRMIKMTVIRWKKWLGWVGNG